MPNQFITLAELAAINADSQMAGFIEQNIRHAPEVGLLPARTIGGTTYTTVARVNLPGSAFRKLNSGVNTGKGGYEVRTADMKYLDGQLQVDKAAAQKDSRGVGKFLDQELNGQVESHLRYLGRQLWYGSKTNGDADGPLGGMDVVPAAQVVDATGTTANTGASVWFISLAPDLLELLFGQDQVMSKKAWREQQVALAGGKVATAFVNAVEGWAGFNVLNQFAFGRIKNLTAETGKGMTDNLAYSLWSKFPSAVKPTHAVMSKRSREQLRVSRATPLIPAPPLPDNVCGIPIVETESLLDTEAIA